MCFVWLFSVVLDGLAYVGLVCLFRYRDDALGKIPRLCCLVTLKRGVGHV